MNHHTLPNGWRRVSLEDVAHIQTGLAIGRTVNDDPVKLPYLRVANVQDGYLNLTEIKDVIVSRNDAERFRLQDGDVLMTEGGDFDKLGRGCVWESPIPHCLHQNHVFAVRTVREKLLPQFFAYHAAGPIGRLYLLSCSKQSTNLASINSTQLKQMPVPVPPLREQAAIASLLATWDKAIAQTTTLIASKTRLKRGIAQQLLTGSQRLPEFRKSYRPSIQLGKILTKASDLVHVVASESYREIGIRSHGKGIFHKEPVSGASLGDKRVFNVVPGCLVLNIVFAWERALAITSDEEVGMIASHRFPMFQPDLKQVDIQYVLHYMLSDVGSNTLRLASPGGAGRNRTISQEQFLKTEIPLPPVEEQKKIVAIINTAEAELQSLQDKLHSLKKQKRGLMQKLLTGKIRASHKLLKQAEKS
ncbi:MAG: restriction endonuclease subunit S [Planctomycetaceae bacterium]|nr:restriction endonuclease subunit S [Planctomycetaceae bacterium]